MNVVENLFSQRTGKLAKKKKKETQSRQMCKYKEGTSKEALSIFSEKYFHRNQESPKELF